jgi:hypothetical protein
MVPMAEVERLPLTPEMTAILRSRTNPLPYLAGFAVLAALIVGGGAAGGQLQYAIGSAVAAAIFFVIAFWGFYFPRINRDLRAGIFVRASGPLTAFVSDPPGGDSSTTYLVVCPDGTRLESDEPVVRLIQELAPPRGSVDYAPHAETIFAIRDSTGRELYRDKRL